LCVFVNAKASVQFANKMKMQLLREAHEMNSTRRSCWQKVIHSRCSNKWTLRSRAVFTTTSLFTNGGRATYGSALMPYVVCSCSAVSSHSYREKQ
jgi:hypothetical protein